MKRRESRRGRYDSLLDGRERTQKYWETILDGVGLKVVKTWSWDAGTQAVIEASLEALELSKSKHSGGIFHETLQTISRTASMFMPVSALYKRRKAQHPSPKRLLHCEHHNNHPHRAHSVQSSPISIHLAHRSEPETL